jgi:hypothetical protein
MADEEVLYMKIDSNTGEVTKDVEKLDDATKKTSRSFGKLGNAVKSIGTGIKRAMGGIILGVLASFANALRQNQKIVDIFNVTLRTTSIAFNDLFRFLNDNIDVITGYLKALFTDPIGELYKLGQAIQVYFIDNLSGVVELMKTIGEALVNITNPAQYIKSLAKVSIAIVNARKDINGEFDKLTDKVKEYTTGIIGAANAMVLLDKQAQIAIASNKILLEEKDREAELERQIRDDTTRSFEDRIEASNNLNDILTEQKRLMIANADILVKAAQAQFDLTGNDADRIVFLEAQAEQAGILAQIEGFRSEQKTSAIALDQEAKQVAIDNADAQLAAYSSLANALSGLAGDNKELAAAGAIIDTYAGANKAFAQGGVAGFVSGAAIIAAGLANVRKIYDTPVGGSGGSAGASPTTPAPQMMSGAFELTGGQPTQALRAYVLTDEMTDSQNQLANIRRRATI